MTLLTVCALFSIASACSQYVTDGPSYGNYNNGELVTMECTGNNFVMAVKTRAGNELSAIGIRCSNEAWGPLYGGSGGEYKEWYPSGQGFCGMWGKGCNRVDRLCLTEASSDSGDGYSRCYGGNGGIDFVARRCTDAPGNARTRLKGFIIRHSGGKMHMIQPIWHAETCKNFISVSQAPAARFNGDYAFDSWVYGHPRYHQITTVASQAPACIYKSTRQWQFGPCDIGYVNGRLFGYFPEVMWIQNIDDGAYQYCPYNLGGHSSWEINYNDGNGWNFVYPHLGLVGLDSAPLRWGNAMGYWAFYGSGQGFGGGDEVTLTVERYSESATARSFSTEEETAFASTEEFSDSESLEVGYEVGVEAGFGSMSASQKYTSTTTMTDSTTASNRNNVINSFEQATTQGDSTSSSCTSRTPEGRYETYVWTVYRASSEENVGAAQQTCNFQHQAGACRWIPPNCPVATCEDLYCVTCREGVKPLIPLPDLQAEFPACFDEMGLEVTPTETPWPEDMTGRRLLDLEEVNSKSQQNSNAAAPMVLQEDEIVVEEDEHETPSGCGQFDDEGHCVAGPLYKFCQWDASELTCVPKDEVSEDEIPDTDFTWIYSLRKNY